MKKYFLLLSLLVGFIFFLPENVFAGALSYSEREKISDVVIEGGVVAISSEEKIDQYTISGVALVRVFKFIKGDSADKLMNVTYRHNSDIEADAAGTILKKGDTGIMYLRKEADNKYSISGFRRPGY